MPEYPEEVNEEDRFLILPDTIAEQYVLQIPPTDEELQATRAAELEAFLALSLPVEDLVDRLARHAARRTYRGCTCRGGSH